MKCLRLQRKWIGAGFAVIFGFTGLLLVAGCEINSYFDPSVQGRWDRTPIILPILSRLDIIDEPQTQAPGLRPVTPEDLIAEDQEYVIGSGDLVTISIFELMAPNVETVQTRRVDEVGQIRLPVLGRVRVANETPSSLEEKLAQMLEDRGILKDPTVSVIVQENRRKVFSVIGTGGGSVGIYSILQNDFRLMDALALSGASTTARKIYVIRNVQIGDPETIEGVEEQRAPGQAPAEQPSELIDILLEGRDGEGAMIEDVPAVEQEPRGAAPPQPLEAGLEQSRDMSRWVQVEGEWRRVEGPTELADGVGAELVPDQRQVVIEVPFDKLMDGDMGYNLVIRPGDILRFPPPITGNVYLGGAVARPGTYALPGEQELTLRQLIFSAGGFSQLAHPERVDLIRRLDDNQEVIIRLNVKGIFEGTQPDFYLKPSDTVNVGTSLFASLLSIARNGLRLSYGFGFVFDRNFSPGNDNR